eukprot:6591051-Prymnesium_polylepis.1
MEVDQGGGGGAFDAMRIPAAAGAAPHPIRLARRVDYLTVVHEALGATAPLGMHARYKGQVSEQPMLYFQCAVDGTAARNAFASQLAGFTICGDAILADAMLYSHHGEPQLLTAADHGDGVASCEAFLAEHGGHLLGFLQNKMGWLLLGSWAGVLLAHPKVLAVAQPCPHSPPRATATSE